MISNQILQNTIDGVKGITKIDLSVVDADGNVLDKTVRRFWDTSFLRFMMRAS